ncbi:MAG: hypothetical protein WC725_05070 [Patescibacteria group bacterium]|jgi:hypothetical protein
METIYGIMLGILIGTYVTYRIMVKKYTKLLEAYLSNNLQTTEFQTYLLNKKYFS